ncbi:MAG TPA: DUF3237 domain-containing protein [Candidatus Binataceae bacterium]|jgi:hypothetical protein
MQNELLFDITAYLAPPITILATPEGDRLIIYVTGGEFSGPRLRGEVLPGGGDWFLIRPDGMGTLDVRIVLKTDNGEYIYMVYRGIAQLPPGGLGAGPFPIRTAPSFFASRNGKFAWLNSVQAIGEGEIVDGGVKYRVYEAR